MSRTVPSREDWDRLRPEITEWYKTKTADWIVQWLRNHGFNVTAKMVRDRFRVWKINKKYSTNEARSGRVVVVRRRLKPDDARNANSLEQNPRNAGLSRRVSPSGCGNRLTISAPSYSMSGENAGMQMHLVDQRDAFMSFEPSRTLDTPTEEQHLRHTLAQECRYLDQLVETGSWRRRIEQPALTVQKLAANAHMAISSQIYGSHRSWQDLSDLKQPAEAVMTDMQSDNLLTLHPRALTALLRLVIDGTKVPKAMHVYEADTLRVVKKMFGAAAKRALQSTHPISMLCDVESDKTEELVFRQFELLDVRLFSKISHLPDGVEFVAQEQIYGSRTLASLGYTQWAETKLNSVIEDLPSHRCQYIYADAHRTLGYLQYQACSGPGPHDDVLQEADKNANLALSVFNSMGMMRSNEALYTHICLAGVARTRQRLDECQERLRAALAISEHLQQSCSKLVRDLHQVLIEQQKLPEAQEVQVQYSEYFISCQG